jgi:DNA-binding transcriptional regulator LsrR (DeoR family)
MDIQSQRDLQLLNDVEQNAAVTQRSLARKLGVALGLTNLYLKRLARKGYIKITTIPRHRTRPPRTRRDACLARGSAAPSERAVTETCP